MFESKFSANQVQCTNLLLRIDLDLTAINFDATGQLQISIVSSDDVNTIININFSHSISFL